MYKQYSKSEAILKLQTIEDNFQGLENTDHINRSKTK
jgi:hypothetical protein